MTAEGKPRLIAPRDACDCHMHIYDPRFAAEPSWPLALPNAPVAAYRAVQAELGLSRAVVVQPNGYAFDNACTEEAVRELGPSARGIATIRPDIADADLERLTHVGFRGARCHMLKGGYLAWDDVDAIAARIQPYGWHVQVQLDGRELPQHEARLSRLPVDVVIDHNGKFMEPVPTSARSPAHWPRRIPTVACGRRIGRIQARIPSRPRQRCWTCCSTGRTAMRCGARSSSTILPACTASSHANSAALDCDDAH